jgi:hypothetical protein
VISRMHSTLLQTSTATFSECEKYRYTLTRTWDGRLPVICYLMMNPSTATEVDNDPTIERCQRRATAIGYGGLIVVNIFPYRLTDSRKLKFVEDLIGDQKAADDAIADAVGRSAITICGWGKHNQVTTDRAAAVFKMLEERGLAHKLHALKVNGDGSPQHPLYIGYDQQPEPWRLAA